MVQEDASARGYNFDRSKLGRIHRVAAIAVERGQLEHERMHLLAKLVLRSPPLHQRWCDAPLDVHPLFEPIEGGIAAWERA